MSRHGCLIRQLCYSSLWSVDKLFHAEGSRFKIGNMIKTLKVNSPAKNGQFNADKIAKERYLAENQSDIAAMQAFFSKAGLSLDRSIKCAKKSVIRDIHTPRRLHYFVHSVPDFSLLRLGMDRFDADMVTEDLRKEFGSNPIVTSFRHSSLDSPTGPPPSQTVSFLREKTPPMFRRPTNSELSVSKLMDSLLEISGSQNEADGKRMVLKAVNAFKREKSKKSINDFYAGRNKKSPDDEDNVKDMQEFFRFAGLSVKMSRHCAEEAILVSATSPKKLFKYMQSRRLMLTDLGMDIVDAEMVRDALVKAFPVDPRRSPVARIPKEKVVVMTDSFSQGPDLTSFKSDSSEGKKDELGAASGLSSANTSSKVPGLPLFHRKENVPNGLLSDHSPFKLRQIATAANNKNTENDLRKFAASQYYSKSQLQAYSQMQSNSITTTRDYDLFMTKLSSVMEGGPGSHFISSPHSIGVSTALASLPNRPSSVYRPQNLNPVTVHTELLLLRAASVLKVKH